jgi:Flp pilus assembly protein TadD
MGRSKQVAPVARTHPVLLAGLLLFLAVLAVYFPAAANQFVNVDDNLYVTANPTVQAGLTLRNAAWAFTSTTAGNWHPLTMLSLELDSTLFGKNARGYHLTNLLLHALSTWLLFLALQRMTGQLWANLWVAALFGLHPLHVESVAWVAERKDVLSGLFWMLTLLAYVWYTAAPSWRRYLCVAVSLALGLMAKPMLVTLPCVLLLLDYWPLGRGEGRTELSRPWFWLVREKLPLFALSAVFSVIALYAQQEGEALRSFEDRPLLLRLETAVLAPVVYLRKMVWPVDLAPYYPTPEQGFPAWQVVGALLLLVAITALAWRERKRRPYLVVGWLWYLGTLIPVSGLVQVGDQAWADRYTYLSMIGVFLALAWTVRDFLTAQGSPRWLLPAVAAGCAALCVVPTHFQIGYWQDDLRLWRHTLAVTSGNSFAHNNLGVYLGQKHLDEAMAHFAEAVAINPKDSMAQVNLAKGLALQGKEEQAMQQLNTALELRPQNAAAHLFLGRLYLQRGDKQRAVEQMEESLRLKPHNPETLFYLGQAYGAADRLDDAVRTYSELVTLSPDNASAFYLLGFALCQLHHYAEAVPDLRKAVQLKSQDVGYHCDLAYALYELGQKDRALAAYRAAGEIEPGWTERLNSFVLDRLSKKDSDSRAGDAALIAAEQICQATGCCNPHFLDTLAAAYAATGHLSEARQTARQALDLAKASHQDQLVKQIQERIAALGQH